MLIHLWRSESRSRNAGMAQRDQAGQYAAVEARQCKTMQAKASQGVAVEVRSGVARLGLAWCGISWQSRQGAARRGIARHFLAVTVRCGSVKQGAARHSWQSGLGEARQSGACFCTPGKVRRLLTESNP